MFSRLTTSLLAVVFGVSALATTGCAATTGDDESADATETSAQALAVDPSSLLETAQQWGQKAGPALSLAGTLYGFYQDVPGKLDAMNAKLDVIAGDTAAIKSQLAVIDTKMDEQFKADFLAPMGAAENYISIDMKNLVAALQNGSNVDESLWLTTSTALSSQLEAADTASEKVLTYFAPEDAVASKWTATQWFRIYGYYLRASLVKIALRDAQATLASTYFDRTPTAEYAARKQMAVANLVSTVQDVAPTLRRIRGYYVTARDLPGLLAQQCFVSGTYQNIISVDLFLGVDQVMSPYESFRDPGAQYTSQQFPTARIGKREHLNTCEERLGAYRYDMAPRIETFIKDSLDAPIASIEAIPANWDAK